MAADLLRVGEFADAMGFSVAAVRLWESEGRIKSIRFGSAIRFRREELDRVLREGIPRKAKAS